MLVDLSDSMSTVESWPNSTNQLNNVSSYLIPGVEMMPLLVYWIIYNKKKKKKKQEEEKEKKKKSGIWLRTPFSKTNRSSEMAIRPVPPVKIG